MGEVSLLAFDPAKGITGLVDLSAATDVKLLQVAGRSWGISSGKRTPK
jgi:hypothetical protein